MPNRKAKLTLALAAALLSGHSAAQATDTQTEPASAASETMPGAYEILEKHVEAIGGKEAWMETEGMRMVGSFDMPSFGMKGPIEIAVAAPNKQSVRVEVPGMGTVYEGTDGKAAWETPMPGQPATMLEGETLEKEIKDADYYAEFSPKKKFPEAEVVGLVTHNDTKAYKLKLVSHTGQASTALFDKESGLLVQVMTTLDTPSGEQTMTTEYRDYREVKDGLMAAYGMKIVSPMFTQVLKFDTIEINPDFEKGTFDPPGAL